MCLNISNKAFIPSIIRICTMSRLPPLSILIAQPEIIDALLGRIIFHRRPNVFTLLSCCFFEEGLMFSNALEQVFTKDQQNEFKLCGVLPATRRAGSKTASSFQKELSADGRLIWTTRRLRSLVNHHFKVHNPLFTAIQPFFTMPTDKRD